MLKKTVACILALCVLGGSALAASGPIPVNFSVTNHGDAAFKDHTYLFYSCNDSACQDLNFLGQQYEDDLGNLNGDSQGFIDSNKDQFPIRIMVVAQTGKPGPNVKATQADIAGTYIYDHTFTNPAKIAVSFDAGPEWFKSK